MDNQRVAANKNLDKSSLFPSINGPQPNSYSQKYSHMTKISNYTEMNQPQIWKQYEKLRICLKQLNEEVLNLMEKKAYANLSSKDTPPPPTIQATLLVLEEERKTNQSRLQIYTNQASAFEQKINQLINKTSFLQEIDSQIQIAQSKIKQISSQNKELKRKQKLDSKDLTIGSSLIEKLTNEEEALQAIKRKYNKNQQIYNESMIKAQQHKEKVQEEQATLQKRINQYKKQQHYIAEELNLQKFEELEAHKANLQKYESVYKRSYLMKLKQLQNLVNNITKQEEVIQSVQTNNSAMRKQIQKISAIVGISQQTKRRSSMGTNQRENVGFRSVRKSNIANTSVLQQEKSGFNDKNLE